MERGLRLVCKWGLRREIVSRPLLQFLLCGDLRACQRTSEARSHHLAVVATPMNMTRIETRREA